MDDRHWMYTGRRSQSDYTTEWMNKTDAFLNRAFGKAAKGHCLVLCPCSKCGNRRRVNKVDMGKHLLKNGFTPDYTRWVHHGEALEARLEQEMRQRQELEAEQQRMSAQLEAEQAERQAQTQRLADITEFLQGLGQHTGFAVPAGLLAPPPPPRPAAAATPPQSAGSNNPPHAPPNDGAFPSPQSQWPPSR